MGSQKGYLAQPCSLGQNIVGIRICSKSGVRGRSVENETVVQFE